MKLNINTSIHVDMDALYNVCSLIEIIKIDINTSIHVDIDALYNVLVEFVTCFQISNSKHYNP